MSARKAWWSATSTGGAGRDHEQILACLTEDVVWDIVGYKHLEGRDAYDAEIENPDLSDPHTWSSTG